MYSNSPGSPRSPKQKQETTACPSSPSKLIKKVRLYHAPVTFYSLLLKQEESSSISLIPDVREVIITPTEEEINDQEENRRNSVTFDVEIFDTEDTLTEVPESLTENFEEEGFEEDSFSSTSNDSDLDYNKYNKDKKKNLLRP